MSKETRIGLLVGLLFIIMFGLVLSELTGTSQLPPVPAAAEEHVGAYAHTPVIDDYGVPPVPPRPTAPPSPEVSRSHRAVASAGGTGTVESVLSGPAVRVPRGGVIESEVRSGAHVLAAHEAGRGERSEPAVTPVPAAPPAPAAAPTRRADPPAPRRRVYTVQPNDSLIRIARKVYGADKAMEYKRIYRANRGELQDEGTVRIGQELVIPPLPGATPEPAPARAGGTERRRARTPTPPTGAPSHAVMTAEQLQRDVEARSGEAERRTRRRWKVYTVRRGDSLSSIARRMMGNDRPGTVQKLFHANRDRLDSPHLVPVGVELSIPNG